MRSVDPVRFTQSDVLPPRETLARRRRLSSNLQEVCRGGINHRAKMKDPDGCHDVSTLVGDANRNGYQQRKAGWLGGHAAPSALGFHR